MDYVDKVSQERRDYSRSVGNAVEQQFIDACLKIGYVCEKTTDNVDIYKHIDFYIYRPNGTFTSVDVKGGNHPKTIWVEFKNVSGNNGWLYGESEYIAFHLPELVSFLMIKRLALVERCENIVEKVFVSKDESHKKLYTRKDRKDVISKLYLEDIEDIIKYKLYF